MKKIGLFIGVSLLPFVTSPAQRNDIQRMPAIAWKFRAAGPFVGSAISDGNLLFAGSHDSVFYALRPDDGAVEWKFRSGGKIRSTPLVDGGKIFLNAGDGRLVALEPSTGRLRWTFQTGGEKVYEPYGYADYFHSSPAAANGIIFFGSGDGFIYAVNGNDGSLKWRFGTGEPVHATPLLSNGILFVGSFDGTMYALDQQDGRLIWKFKSVGHRYFPQGEFQGSPATGNGLIYVGSRDYNLYAIDAIRGFCHWNRQFPLGWAMALTVRDSVLYVGTSDDDLMMAFDGRNGKELWRTNVQFNVFGPCTTTDSLLYVGSLMGRVHALHRRTGILQWIFETDGLKNHRAEYFSSGDRIVKSDFYAKVGNPDGYIAALCRLGAVFSTPLVVGRRLIVTSADGTVYCLQ